MLKIAARDNNELQNSLSTLIYQISPRIFILLIWMYKKILNLSQKKALFIYEYVFFENNNNNDPKLLKLLKNGSGGQRLLNSFFP